MDKLYEEYTQIPIKQISLKIYEKLPANEKDLFIYHIMED